MRNKNLFSDFTRQYNLLKTLRFELIPQGKTEEFIKQKKLLEQDAERSDDYKKVKDLIDECHKHFIEESLPGKKLEKALEYYDEFTKSHSEMNLKALDKLNESMRKEVAKWLKDNPTKDGKKLISEKVPDFLRGEGRSADADLVLKFKKFTTYFVGFNNNRKNIYSDKEQSTAISYRIVHENLPRFMSNVNTFVKLIRDYDIDFSEVEIGMQEELNGNKLEDIFSPDYFNNCLTQDGIDCYNAIIGGKTEKEGNKIQGVNEKINLFRQKKSLNGKQVPGMARLYKQILSDRTSSSYLPEKIKSADELVNSIKEFYEQEINSFVKDNSKKNVIDELEKLLKRIHSDDFEPSKIYIGQSEISSISQQMFGSYAVIKNALEAFTERDYISISEIEESIKEYLKDVEIDNKERREEILKQKNPILQYFSSILGNIEISKGKKAEINLIDYLRQRHDEVQAILSLEYDNNGELIQNKKSVSRIKDYLDSYKHIFHFVKPLFVDPPKKNKGVITDKDYAFYNEFEELFLHLKAVIPLYNKVRNFLTQKPYSVEKYKLNFANVSLLAGWDVNKETANTSLIFRKGGFYYLGIMDKGHNKSFENIPKFSDEEDCYNKMNYKLLPGANKMLPKVIFSDKWIKFFDPSKVLMKRYKDGTHKKGDDFSLTDCHTLIDFFKASIAKHPDWQQFNFNFSPTRTYKDISGFYREVENQGYKIDFEKVSSAYIDKLVSEGKLYLFKIYNKDFSPYSKGKPNLHTLYWKAIFSDANLKDVVFKLNGEAEIFYRPLSIKGKSKIIHKQGKPIDNKNPNNPKKKSRFDYPIVKDKRYTENKYQFHVPITLNFKSGNTFKINDMVKEVLREYPNINIIGIDRGERHLAYYSVINPKGEIIEQNTFNVVKNEYKGVKYVTDYHASLTEKEKARDLARKSWDTIGNIKNLKEGYLSQVVHKIAQLMVKHNAIVVFEDLNFGFKRGRMKVEKQVYQKLEKMLIDKLNYLIFKDYDQTDPGGLLNAYQLTAKFKSFKDMGKQTGFIFYVPAANTSKIDFATGFVNLLYPKCENKNQAKTFFEKFESICFNPDKNYFEFEVDYNQFRTKEAEKLKKSRWVICTSGEERYQYIPSKKENVRVNVTQKLKDLCKEHAIPFDKGDNIQQDILYIEDAKFFKTIIYLLKLTLQMRYCDGNSRDFILSPVANEEGIFFNSENATDAEPKDADANGAYHIALKGLLQVEKIRRGEDKLAISNREWYDFVQGQAYRQ